MTSLDFDRLLQVLDAHLRTGRADLCASALDRLPDTSFERAQLLPLAVICRRAGLFTRGLKLLSSLVRPDKKRWLEPASTREIAEYAALLTRNGSLNEALTLLEPLTSDQVPEVELFRAFAWMAKWDYERAVAALRRYMQEPLEDYASLVAQVNLSSALIATGQFSEALQIISPVVEITRKQRQVRLYANSLELRGQIHLFSGRWQQSEEDLEASSRQLERERTNDQLYAEKWRAILQAFRTQDVEPIERFRPQAVQRGHWETVRDLDRHSLQIRFDEERFRYLIYGTPHHAFRERVVQRLGRELPIGGFRYNGEGKPWLDLTTGEIHESGAVGLANPSALKVTAALLTDFYRPLRLGVLFAELFPNDHFDVFSSANRVHQTLSRARAWLKEHGLPFSVAAQNGEYRLQAQPIFAFEVPLHRTPAEDLIWNRLMRSFLGAEFGADEACRVLEISRPTYLRWAEKARAQGRLKKRFQGRGTRYRLAG
ncbi:MAG: hypothetical protein KF799_01760 [Bdellovibrionales bacterium]|nr:hypothetical protein [Bdellovibrionales bacterium]